MKSSLWWFINAQGERFVSLGVKHIEPHLWLAPYNRAATLKRYGRGIVGIDGLFNTGGEAAKKWINRQVEVTQSLHFNTFGPHTHSRYGSKQDLPVDSMLPPVVSGGAAAGLVKGDIKPT